MAPPKVLPNFKEAHDLVQLVMRTRAAYEVDDAAPVNDATYHPIELDYFAKQYDALSDVDKAVVLTHLKHKREHSVLKQLLPALLQIDRVECAKNFYPLSHDYIESYRQKLNQPSSIDHKRLLVAELLAGLDVIMNQQSLMVGGLLVHGHCEGSTTLEDIERFRNNQVRSPLFNLYRNLGPAYFDTDEDGVYDNEDPQPLDRNCSFDQDNDGVCVEWDSKPDDPNMWIDLKPGERVNTQNISVVNQGGKFLIHIVLQVKAKKSMRSFTTQNFLQSLSKRLEFAFARAVEKGSIQATLKVDFVPVGANAYADVNFVKSGRADQENWDEASLMDPQAKAILHELGHWWGWEDYYYEPMVVDDTFNPGYEILSDQEKHWMKNHDNLLGAQIPQQDLRNFLAKVAIEGEKSHPRPIGSPSDEDFKTVTIQFDRVSPPSEQQVAYSVVILGSRNKLVQALELAKQAYEHYRSFRILRVYCNALIKAKRKPEAIDLARKYYEKFPNQQHPFEYLLDLLADDKFRVEALTVARRHCQRQPNTKSRVMYLVLLKTLRDKRALALALLKGQYFYSGDGWKEALFDLPRSFPNPKPWMKRVSNYLGQRVMNDPLELTAYVDWARFLLEYDQVQAALDVMAQFADAQSFVKEKDFIEYGMTRAEFRRQVSNPLRKAAAKGLLVREDLEGEDLLTTSARRELFRSFRSIF